MKYNIIFLGIYLVLLTGCLTPVEECDIKNVAKAYKTANYNPAVLKNMKSYLAFGNFLWVNRSEIVHYTTKVLNGNKDSKDDITWAYTASDTALIPIALRYEFNRLIKRIDNKLIYSFGIVKSIGITIYITPNDQYDSNDVAVVHVLNYVDAELAKTYTVIGGGKGQFARDTLIKKDWTYSVYVNCYESR